MKANSIFLAELYVGKCKIAQLLPSKVYLAFRIGKKMTQVTLPRTANDGYINVDATLQLNTDKLALDTQRSSLTLSSIAPNNQITVIGIVLIPLPPEGSKLQKKCRLTQCIDKSSEIQITLLIKPFDPITSPDTKIHPNTLLSSGISSSHSIMEMQQFDRKMQSPPCLFIPNKESRLLNSQRSSRVCLPKLGSTKELTSTSLELRESIVRLEKECESLKQLLKTEMKKGDESNRLIDSLVSALEQIEQTSASRYDPEQTFLLDGINSVEPIDNVSERIVQLQKEVKHLNQTILQISSENEKLKQQLFKNAQKQYKGFNQLQKQQHSNKSILNPENLVVEVDNFQKEFIQKWQQIQRYKKKMKIIAKLPSLKPLVLQKLTTPTLTIKQIFNHCINQNKQMVKLLLRYIKQESDGLREGLIVKLKQKIDKTFGSLLTKKMNKEICLFQKGELIKGVEELWQNA